MKDSSSEDEGVEAEKSESASSHKSEVKVFLDNHHYHIFWQSLYHCLGIDITHVNVVCILTLGNVNICESLM